MGRVIGEYRVNELLNVGRIEDTDYNSENLK